MNDADRKRITRIEIKLDGARIDLRRARRGVGPSVAEATAFLAQVEAELAAEKNRQAAAK